MRLLFQSDDFGITEAVTLGIVKGIEEGLIRNTGLFTNMPSSAFAAEFIPKLPQCCFGIDINLVGGKPLSDPSTVKSLVDENGNFITSIRRFKENKLVNSEMMNTVFEEDPYVYADVIVEMEAQINRYIELVGAKPEYLHPHSLITPNIFKAMEELGAKYDIPLSSHKWQSTNFTFVPANWNIKPVFDIDKQRDTDVAKLTLESLKSVAGNENLMIICHAGYVDADLLGVSSYSLIRARDLEMAISPELIKYVEDNNIELITYRDL